MCRSYAFNVWFRSIFMILITTGNNAGFNQKAGPTVGMPNHSEADVGQSEKYMNTYNGI